ncbi:hypothetical protein ZOSMA_71G00340 [Zostera marina]|uniref:Protein BPS1, chloroplastic n=1 Tax=Zostera marina TaxID=29655 RepID=A0A0K9NSI9_ZOSMR|nr:hypothetical protein ZOSMA_71G00340 [Zostera marina]
MSRSHEGYWPFGHFSSTFKMIFPNGFSLSPKYYSLLHSFEVTLSGRLKKLKPQGSSDVLSLLWMRDAIESLSETHTDIKSLITDLQFPINNWDNKWMDIYLDSSAKLLDICIAFSAKMSRIDQGHLFHKYVLHVLDFSCDSTSVSEQNIKQVRKSLYDWMQHINNSSPRFNNSLVVLQELITSLDMTKVKNSSKGKVLTYAMYGARVHTIFVCTVLWSALSGSQTLLVDLAVPEKFLWTEAFNDLQNKVTGQIRSYFPYERPVVLKEVAAVDQCVENILSLISKVDENKRECCKTAETLQCHVLNLSESSKNLAHRLDLVSNQMGNFFQIVLSGRDALLCNLQNSDI